MSVPIIEVFSVGYLKQVYWLFTKMLEIEETREISDRD